MALETKITSAPSDLVAGICGGIKWDGTNDNPVGDNIVFVKTRDGGFGRMNACDVSAKWKYPIDSRHPGDILEYAILKDER